VYLMVLQWSKDQKINMVITYLKDNTLCITEPLDCKVIVQAPSMTLERGILYYVDTKQNCKHHSICRIQLCLNTMMV